MVDFSWGDIRPELPEPLVEFARDPFGYIWTIFVEGILLMWSAFLSYVELLWQQLAVVPTTAIATPVITTIYGVLMGLVSAWTAIGSAINAIVLELGLAAPVAALIAWTAPILLVAVLWNAVSGLVGTYVPLDALPSLSQIPYIGGWFD
ncbi:hypothetical protein OB955_24985 [Halobacteria archaeon AArc-m2/3/4]|uniref:Yip1 domain-containing protein n=1 Tax=Natronoglomus mannanivorans TaxID=2979990 RepID=A0ABT2QLW9_9EURY|nr:hypothetical protein [Halobacteria archaeon AArc-m2/3/4]